MTMTTALGDEAIATNSLVTTDEAIQRLILTYLTENPDFLRIIKHQFDDIWSELEMVDEETEVRIGQALANIKTGNYTRLTNQTELTAYLNRLAEEANISVNV